MGGTGAQGRKLGKIIKLIFTIPLTDTDGRVHWLAEKSINAGLALFRSSWAGSLFHPLLSRLAFPGTSILRYPKANPSRAGALGEYWFFGGRERCS